DGARRGGRRDGGRQRGLRHPRRAAGGHDRDPLRAPRRARRRGPLHGPLDGAAQAPPVLTVRVLLHSGGPLGADGRAQVRRFLEAGGGALPRVAFVTAATLGDEVLYFERVRAMLVPPPPEGAGLDLLHLRWRHAPL